MAICGIPLSAQTPYDSFAPQAYSPILDWDSIQAVQKQDIAEEFTLQADTATIVLTPCLAHTADRQAGALAERGPDG